MAAFGLQFSASAALTAPPGRASAWQVPPQPARNVAACRAEEWPTLAASLARRSAGACSDPSAATEPSVLEAERELGPWATQLTVLAGMRVVGSDYDWGELCIPFVM